MLEASGAPSLRDPTPVCRFSVAKEGGLWGPGGLGHGKQLRPPPPVSFPRLGSFPCRTSITQDGLAEPNYSSLGMWAGPPLRLVWGCSLQLGATVLLSSRAVPRGTSLSPVPRGTFNSTRCLEAKGWGSARSNRRGASSVCLGPSPKCATYIHLWVRSSMPHACQCIDTHVAGIWDSTCVCLLLSHQGQPSQGHSPHLWLL